MKITNKETPHYAIFSCLLESNILLSALFSNALNLCFSLRPSDQVSHPYKTTDKIMVFYILVFVLYVGEGKEKDS
jgi:phosphate starvation-inducible membrane PsiE